MRNVPCAVITCTATISGCGTSSCVHALEEIVPLLTRVSARVLPGSSRCPVGYNVNHLLVACALPRKLIWGSCISAMSNLLGCNLCNRSSCASEDLFMFCCHIRRWFSSCAISLGCSDMRGGLGVPSAHSFCPSSRIRLSVLSIGRGGVGLVVPFAPLTRSSLRHCLFKLSLP